jgi:hypothetical protein
VRAFWVRHRPHDAVQLKKMKRTVLLMLISKTRGRRDVCDANLITNQEEVKDSHQQLIWRSG